MMSPAPSRRGRGAVSSRERRWRGAWQLDRMEHLGPVLLQLTIIIIIIINIIIIIIIIIITCSSTPTPDPPPR